MRLIDADALKEDWWRKFPHGIPDRCDLMMEITKAKDVTLMEIIDYIKEGVEDSDGMD